MNLKRDGRPFWHLRQDREMGRIKEERERREAGGETWRTVQRSSWGARSNGNATGRSLGFLSARMGVKQSRVHQIFI